MSEIQEMLHVVADQMVIDLKESMANNNRVATGSMAESLEVVDIEDGVAIYAHPFIWVIETGRKPTPPGTLPSDPTLVQALVPWLAARGIDENAKYAIAKKIHQEGWEGTPGILSGILNDDHLSEILYKVFEAYSDGVVQNFLTSLFSFSDV